MDAKDAVQARDDAQTDDDVRADSAPEDAAAPADTAEPADAQGAAVMGEPEGVEVEGGDPAAADEGATSGGPDDPAGDPLASQRPADVDSERDPGRGLGIAAVILAFPGGVIGLILGVLALRRSKAAGFPGTLGIAAIVIGVAALVLAVLGVYLQMTGYIFGGPCDVHGPGIHTLDDGTRLSCR